MEQHPVPQQISAYHFRLVGDMTIKQFLELLGGVVIAWIIYSLPISAILRWPLILTSVFAGVAFAFLPLEERPLDRWLSAFIKAVYSPTKFTWKKKVIFPAFFAEIKIKKQEAEDREQVDRSKLQEYLKTLPASGPQSSLDNREDHFVSDIMKIYTEVQPTTTAKVIRPKVVVVEEERERVPNVKVRKLKTPPINPRAILMGEVILPKRHGIKPKNIDIPEVRPVEIDKIPSPLSRPETAEPAKTDEIPYSIEGLTTARVVAPKPPDRTPTVSATLKPTLPIPAPPTQPNVIVGMVTDNKGNIVENAIVTIKDKDGNVARAQKSNKIGQFFIATPLENGNYQIDIEKEGLSFDIIKIELTGKPILPVEIKAK